MIRQVTFDKSTYNELPYKFEAGTPNVAGMLGLESALDYLNTIGPDAIARYESDCMPMPSAFCRRWKDSG